MFRSILISTASSLVVTTALLALTPEERMGRVEEVRASELAFARSVAVKDRDAFAAKIDPDAVFVGGGGPTVGKERIVEEWAAFFADGAPEFEWHPEVVELSGDGTLGLSRGPWMMTGTRKDGTPFEHKGLFNSVWRRQEDGSWKIVFDAGCDPCPACGD